MMKAMAVRVTGDKQMANAMADAAAMQEIKRLREELEWTRLQLKIARSQREKMVEKWTENQLAPLRRKRERKVRFQNMLESIASLFIVKEEKENGELV